MKRFLLFLGLMYGHCYSLLWGSNLTSMPNSNTKEQRTRQKDPDSPCPFPIGISDLQLPND